jgi:hypothetical protein
VGPKKRHLRQDIAHNLAVAFERQVNAGHNGRDGRAAERVLAASQHHLRHAKSQRLQHTIVRMAPLRCHNKDHNEIVCLSVRRDRLIESKTR